MSRFCHGGVSNLRNRRRSVHLCRLRTRLAILDDKRRSGADRRVRPGHVGEHAVVALPSLRGKRAAHIATLSVEEFHMRIQGQHRFAVRVRVAAIAARADRGADELSTDRRGGDGYSPSASCSPTAGAWTAAGAGPACWRWWPPASRSLRMICSGVCLLFFLPENPS